MRKGMSAEWAMVVVIIAGIVMVIAAIVYTTLYDVGKKEFSKRECQLSLQLTRSVDRTFRYSCINPLPSPIPLKCARRFLDVTKDDVLSEGKSVRYQYNPSCDPDAKLVEAWASQEQQKTDEQQAKKQEWTGGACLAQNVLAKEMASCWSTFFEGEFPVFQQVENDVWEFWKRSKGLRACFVCAEVTLGTGHDLTDFRESYLKRKLFVQQRSYYDYLARNRNAFCPQGMREKSPDGTCWGAMGVGNEIPWYTFWKGLSDKEWPSIDQQNYPDGKTYAVVFMRQGLFEQCESEDDIDEGTIPLMTVQAVPAENIGQYCDVVMV
jgi:hypothetical protein